MAAQRRDRSEDEAIFSLDDVAMSNSYDAYPNEGVVGVPTLQDLTMWTSTASQFIRSDAGITEDSFVWVGKQPLGQGAFGLVGLWEKVDREGNVVDKMVIKQVGPRKNGSWDPDKPQEVRIMEEMNKTGTLGVVELRNYRRYATHKIHRIYMEYCPYGDLRKLYKRYRKFRQYIPEPFLWEVFYYLTEACMAMKRGPPEAFWENEIVHRDIKPLNIFLGVEDSRANPFYPVAKLGDFGLAVQTSIDDPDNPSRLSGYGTRRYMAPEQRRRRKLPPYLLAGNNKHLSSQTNLWAVGATMYELLTLHYVWPALFAEGTDPKGTMEGLPDITTGKIPEYSAELRMLIQRCLRPRADHRPNLARLRRKVGEYRQKMADNLDQTRKDDLVPLDEERLYFRGKEIETMKPGNWQPSAGRIHGGQEGPESGFADPNFTPIRFPQFASPDPDSDDDDDYYPESDDADESMAQ